jgi:hypothetical protein
VLDVLRSIEEVAIQLGVSKTAIYNKLKLKGYKELVIKRQGKAMVDDELFNLIKDNIKLSNKAENQINKDDVNQEVSIGVDDILKINEDLINLLKEQLKEKDIQLREKDKQIEDLHKLVENNQVLLKHQQDKAINQLQLEEHFQEVDEKLMDLRAKLEHKENTKKGFFKNFLK